MSMASEHDSDGTLGASEEQKIVSGVRKISFSECSGNDQKLSTEAATAGTSSSKQGGVITESCQSENLPKQVDEDTVHSNSDVDEMCEDWLIDEDYLRERDKDASNEEKQARKEESEKLKADGNDLYKNASYLEAARAYTRALMTCPLSFRNERAILYSNRAACFLYMENEKEEGVMDCGKALEINPNYLKALLRRALLYEKLEKLDEALNDYKKVLELEPRDPRAIEACMRLPDEINQRNDKLKAEMLGKLKDLGNMILKPFGLSTENFKMQQDPKTGSYSMNFQQGK